MSFRTVVISSQSKLSYKNDYLVVRNEEGSKYVHLSEIETLMIDSTMVSISSYLLCKLTENKIKIILCDEKRNPYGEVVPYYGSYNNSKKIAKQIEWDTDIKKKIWREIVKYKILNQAYLLRKVGNDKCQMLENYVGEVEDNDETNREGHAAKVYFNALFGNEFSRRQDNPINAALNYGYAIILSTINKEISNNGYLTQIGVKHKNEYNNFNLGCDLMEPFRVVIDQYVYYNSDKEFDTSYKMNLVNLLNHKYDYQGKEFILSEIVSLYVKSALDALTEERIRMLKGFNLYEGTSNENSSIL